MNEITIKTETIGNTTISLTRSRKDNEYFRYINDGNETYEMGFANRKDAEARYERDLANMKGAK